MLDVRFRTGGSAALEFAIVAPVIFLMLIGVFDIAAAAIVNEQVVNAVHMIPVSASSLAVQTDKSTALTVTQVQQTLSEIYAAIPWRRDGIPIGTTSATMTSVTFVQNDPNCVGSQTVTCSFTPQVTWSVAYAALQDAHPFQAVTRACGALTQTVPGANAPGDLTVLPTANVVNPDPILVVDVHYQYTPMFFNFMTGPVDFWASSYWAVRSVDQTVAPSMQYTKYDKANQNGGAGKCAGYS